MEINALNYLLVVFISLGFTSRPNITNETGKSVKVDSCIYIRFNGNPERCFYQTPLGEITNFEYRPVSGTVDSNLLYSVALYKEPLAQIIDREQLQTAVNLKFNTLISSEESLINNLNGKILSKTDIIVDNCQVIKYKVLFTNLSEMDQIEGQKDVIYHTEFFKCKGYVLKLSTYTQSNKENKMIDEFFHSLQIKK